MRIIAAHHQQSAKLLAQVSALAVFCMLCAISPGRAQEAKPAANAASVTRGRYIVEGVAMCGTCHTPHDINGQPDPNHALQGAALWLSPTLPVADWPLRAPRIGGNPPATDDQLVTLLTTGIWIDGKRLRPPMPQFRMTREDAQAVVAYLRALQLPPR
jgi:mono/diheme cytochrome c family protein